MTTNSSGVSLPSGPVYVTRKVHFNAAHRLHNPRESGQWNTETFGPCNNPQWHGHNYELEVTVSGEADPRTGYLIDLKELKDILEAKILQPCDHKNLNEQVPFLQGINPTAENLVKAFWAVLAPVIDDSRRRLHSVRLYETPRNMAEYRGPGDPA